MGEKTKGGFSENKFVKAIGAQRLIVLLVVIALFVFFYIAAPSFRNYGTIVTMLDNFYYIGFMAIGVTFTLLTGGVDLSIGTGMICYALFGGYLISKVGLPAWAGILCTILLGVVIGLANAVLVAVMNLPPFIATLCTMMICRGLGSVLTGGVSVVWPQLTQPGGWFRNIFKINANGTMIPVGFIVLIAFAVIMSIVLNKTRPGRYIIAVGSNKEATRLSGVNVVKWQGLAYVLSGFCAGIAGLAYASAFQTSIQPGIGAGLELDAVGAAIIGGTSMNGGYGTISGTLIGVYIMALLKIGLPLIGLAANWQQVITGLVLIFAVLMDVIRSNKRK